MGDVGVCNVVSDCHSSVEEYEESGLMQLSRCVDESNNPDKIVGEDRCVYQQCSVILHGMLCRVDV